MKNLSFFIISIILLLSLISCKENPAKVQTQPKTIKIQSLTNVHLFGVDFLNSNLGFAVGDSGVILKTTDGGDNWTLLNSGVTNNLFRVKIINTNNIFIGGSDIIAKSTNSGQNWFRIADHDSNDFKDVVLDINFITDSIGFIVGQHGYYPSLFRTTDAGSTWFGGNTDSITGVISTYLIINPSTALVSCVTGYDWPASINKTTDSGNSYHVMIYYENGNLPFGLWSMHTCDGTNIYSVGGGGLIMFSGDTGSTWSYRNRYDTIDLYSVKAFSSQSALACGSKGTLIKTTNYGQSWDTLSTGTTETLSSLSILNSTTAIAVGAHGTIIKITY